METVGIVSRDKDDKDGQPTAKRRKISSTAVLGDSKHEIQVFHEDSELLTTRAWNAYYGIKEAKNVKKARDFFIKAAMAGGNFAKAMCKYKAWNTDRDRQDAATTFMNLAKGLEDATGVERQAAIYATSMLSKCYKLGKGTPRDSKQGNYYLRIAADNDDAYGLYHHGQVVLMENGGVEKDQETKEAISLIKRAADKGYVCALLFLGSFFEDPGRYGTLLFKSNISKAIENWKKAADLEAEDAHYHLGWCYEKGDGVQQDFKKSFEHYRAASAKVADAQKKIGLFYLHGQGVEQKDVKEGVQWLARAVENDSRDAAYHLGKCYRNGVGVKKDPERAMKMFEKAGATPEAKRIEALFDLCHTVLSDNMTDKLTKSLNAEFPKGIPRRTFVIEYLKGFLGPQDLKEDFENEPEQEFIGHCVWAIDQVSLCYEEVEFLNAVVTFKTKKDKDYIPGLLKLYNTFEGLDDCPLGPGMRQNLERVKGLLINQLVETRVTIKNAG
mmetsp:Transcript_176/g.463  ORF Transcript_176/g.463 Transcript_176/m.463 type:complete len:498 (-) Transcript_176:170-1663(-)